MLVKDLVKRGVFSLDVGIPWFFILIAWRWNGFGLCNSGLCLALHGSLGTCIGLMPDLYGSWVFAVKEAI